MPKAELRKGGEKRKDVVPYVKGFRPATKKKQILALGYNNETAIPLELSFTGFKPIKKCTSVDDWLAQYEETDQSYADFMEHWSTWLSTEQQKYPMQRFESSGKTLPDRYPEGKIYILPVGEFDSSEQTCLDALIEYTQISIGLSVRKLPALELQKANHCIYAVETDTENKDSSSCTKAKINSRLKKHKGVNRYQLNVKPLLTLLGNRLPRDAFCLVALTNQDLYQDDTDLFVAGMASGFQRAAIFSLFRYNPNMEFSPEFWYDIKTKREYNVCETKLRGLKKGSVISALNALSVQHSEL